MVELNKDDGMEIDEYSEESASSQKTAGKPHSKVGMLSQADDSGPEQKVISGESNEQEACSDGIEGQQNSIASHQVQINPPSNRTIHPRPADQKIQEPSLHSGTLGSPLVPAPAGDGNACKTTTTSFYSTNGKSSEQGEPHESPDQVPQDGMEIEMQNGVKKTSGKRPASTEGSGRETAKKPKTNKAANKARRERNKQ
jgi:hypothetical protein